LRLVLASESPRRAELLRAAGFEFDVQPARVDESVHADEDPEEYVVRVATLKAEVVVPLAEGRPVLGADTVVVVDREILGKPADDADARRMLRLLSGREHLVLTAVCLVTFPPRLIGLDEQGGPWQLDTAVEATTVEFSRLTDAEITWYIGTGEPFGKAGGYAIQGLASRFIPRVAGSYSNVVGLPVSLVYNLCSRAGLLVS
jgi:septum formation protein